MKKSRLEYILSIERRQASRLNTSSGYRLDMAERLIDYPDEFIKKFNAKPVPKNFSYNSGTNSDWETVESLRLLISENL